MRGYRTQNILTATTDSVLTACLAWTAVETQRKRAEQVRKQVHRKFHCWPENRFSSQKNFVGVDNNGYSFLPEIEERLQTGSVLPISNGLIFHHGRQLPSYSQDNYSAPSWVLDNTLAINSGLENKTWHLWDEVLAASPALFRRDGQQCSFTVIALWNPTCTLAARADV